jgi:hypothetical protein
MHDNGIYRDAPRYIAIGLGAFFLFSAPDVAQAKNCKHSQPCGASCIPWSHTCHVNTPTKHKPTQKPAPTPDDGAERHPAQEEVDGSAVPAAAAAGAVAGAVAGAAAASLLSEDNSQAAAEAGSATGQHAPEQPAAAKPIEHRSSQGRHHPTASQDMNRSVVAGATEADQPDGATAVADAAQPGPPSAEALGWFSAAYLVLSGLGVALSTRGV